MAGFFGLFGGKTKYVDEPTPEVEDKEKQEAFFLEPDDAKTLGNVEFMRKPNLIEHTFPKTRSSKGGKVVQEISSLEKKKVTGKGASPLPSPSPTSPPGSQPESARTARRASDSSLDLFRQMAKEMKQ